MRRTSKTTGLLLPALAVTAVAVGGVLAVGGGAAGRGTGSPAGHHSRERVDTRTSVVRHEETWKPAVTWVETWKPADGH
ncbi:MAG: hypothetical protein J2P57_17335 [Acidimicrobiaceae bacterium]|nr:hypothetical protein [Acidimicrobiaceae bacterium]